MVIPLRALRGFTVIELMIAVAIMAILVAIVAPSFSRIVADQRVKSTASNLFLALTVTRSESIKHNSNVTLSPKAGAWANGWVVLDPEGGANLLDANATSVAISGPAAVTYNSAGRIVNAMAAPSFNIGSAGNTQRCVTIDLSGRPTLKAAAC